MSVDVAHQRQGESGPAGPPGRTVAINPAGALLGSRNAILTGTSNRHHVPDFEGCLSIKTVVSGSVMWETQGRQFVVHENSYLVLNDHQHYTMTIDSTRKATTFCLFFERGFVEDVYRSTVTPAGALLDEPAPPAPLQLGFVEKLETGSPRFRALLQDLRWRASRDDACSASHPELIEDGFYRVAEEMIRERQQVEARIADLPALKLGTRIELYQRLLRGRDYLLSTLDQPIRLRDLARAACLSPYHFHRTFTRTFGETPQRYLTRNRLERAAYMLGRNDRSVTEVCLENGFENPASFSSAFRRQFGVSPREFVRASK